MTNTVKYVVYTQNNKLGKTAEFDNAKDVIKWAKKMSTLDYVKEKKDTWEILFEELLSVDWERRGCQCWIMTLKLRTHLLVKQ